MLSVPMVAAAPEERPHVARWRDAYRASAPTRAPFIVDALGPDALSTAIAAGDDLEHRLRDLDPAVETARRVLIAPRPLKESPA